MDYHGQSMYDRRYGDDYQGYSDEDIDAIMGDWAPEPKQEASPLTSKITQCETCGGHNSWGKTYCDLCELAEGYKQILIIDGNVPPEKAEDKVVDLINRTPKKEAA